MNNRIIILGSSGIIKNLQLKLKEEKFVLQSLEKKN